MFWLDNSWQWGECQRNRTWHHVSTLFPLSITEDVYRQSKLIAVHRTIMSSSKWVILMNCTQFDQGHELTRQKVITWMFCSLFFYSRPFVWRSNRKAHRWWQAFNPQGKLRLHFTQYRTHTFTVKHYWKNWYIYSASCISTLGNNIQYIVMQIYRKYRTLVCLYFANQYNLFGNITNNYKQNE